MRNRRARSYRTRGNTVGLGRAFNNVNADEEQDTRLSEVDRRSQLSRSNSSRRSPSPDRRRARCSPDNEQTRSRAGRSPSPAVGDVSSDGKKSIPQTKPGIAPGDDGWGRMSETVRKVDADKVQDYKEDVDTILVFAGLFSAVLTAFLIESYQNLSQDPSDVMIFLLQQVVLQTNTYSINTHFLNSTAPLPAPGLPPFQPSTNAIRVNVLWFASLSLSLISASLGMLVKQWLREFLAGDYTSPHARLRIRHFRYPGLLDWKVFEFAALLPLVLHLSLALFFVGLCFFTADVHNSIGYTTLPLVTAWAFLLISVSFAPVVSPRCPYRSAFLKSTTKYLRIRLFHLISSSHALFLRCSSFSILTSWGVGISHPAKTHQYQQLIYDEEKALNDDGKDIDILVAADAIQSDERLLGVMWDALKQANLEPEPALNFLLGILGNRVQQNLKLNPSPFFLDLKHLSVRTSSTIMDMVGDVLKRKLGPHRMTNVHWDDGFALCVYLLHSEMNAPLSLETSETLKDCMSHCASADIASFIVSRINASVSYADVLLRLKPTLLQHPETLLDVLKHSLEHVFCTECSLDGWHQRSLAPLIGRHREEIPVEHAKVVINILGESLMQTSANDTCWGPRVNRQVDAMIELAEVSSAIREDVKIFIEKALLKRHLLKAILKRAFRPKPRADAAPRMHMSRSLLGPMSPPEHVVNVKNARQLVLESMTNDNPDSRCDQILILSQLGLYFKSIWPRERRKRSRRALAYERRGYNFADDSLDAVELTRVILQAVKWARNRRRTLGTIFIGDMGSSWKSLEKYLIRGIERTEAPPPPSEHTDAALGCFRLIGELEPYESAEGLSEYAFLAWARALDPFESLFSDSLIEALAKLVPDATMGEAGVRARRLAALRAEDNKHSPKDQSKADSTDPSECEPQAPRTEEEQRAFDDALLKARQALIDNTMKDMLEEYERGRRAAAERWFGGRQDIVIFNPKGKGRAKETSTSEHQRVGASRVAGTSLDAGRGRDYSRDSIGSQSIPRSVSRGRNGSRGTVTSQNQLRSRSGTRDRSRSWSSNGRRDGSGIESANLSRRNSPTTESSNRDDVLRRESPKSAEDRHLSVSPASGNRFPTSQDRSRRDDPSTVNYNEDGDFSDDGFRDVDAERPRRRGTRGMGPSRNERRRGRRRRA